MSLLIDFVGRHYQVILVHTCKTIPSLCDEMNNSPTNLPFSSNLYMWLYKLKYFHSHKESMINNQNHNKAFDLPLIIYETYQK